MGIISKRRVVRLGLTLVGLIAVLGTWLFSTFASSPIDAAAYDVPARVVPTVTDTARVSLLATGAVTSKEGFMYRGGDRRSNARSV